MQLSHLRNKDAVVHLEIYRQHVVHCQLNDCTPLEWSAARGGDVLRAVAFQYKAHVRQNHNLQRQRNDDLMKSEPLMVTHGLV